ALSLGVCFAALRAAYRKLQTWGVGPLAVCYCVADFKPAGGGGGFWGWRNTALARDGDRGARRESPYMPVAAWK
ncbi:MAG: hypothetical protein LBB47_01310, partial [Spirochaetaceae bacterium]|nr:hypothetical protein [Spirochaetaceae bacterium]